MSKHTGGCHCGKVTSKTDLEPMLVNRCNCARCRKLLGVVAVAAMFGEDEVEYLPKRPGEMRETLCTDTKAREMLGWTPKKDVIEFIKETYILDK